MIFALAVFSLLCAVMVWIGLRLPEKVRPQAAPKTSSAVVRTSTSVRPASETPRRVFYYPPRVAGYFVLRAEISSQG
jgi:hypothetical protein